VLRYVVLSTYHASSPAVRTNTNRRTCRCFGDP